MIRATRSSVTRMEQSAAAPASEEPPRTLSPSCDRRRGAVLLSSRVSLPRPGGSEQPRGIQSMRSKCFGSAISVIVLFLFTNVARAEDAKATTPAPSTTAQRYGTWGVDLDGMDRSVKPGDDFFKYVNGKWAATTVIPPDKTAYGAFAVLSDLSEARVHALLDRWAADKSLKPGSDEAKVAMIYRTFLDEATADKLDVKPIQPHLDAVKKAQTHEDLARLMGGTSRRFGSSFFGVRIADDAKNPDKYVVYVGQSGLGLADREFYLKDKFKPQKDAYQKYVAGMLRLIGWDEPEKSAADIVAMETQIADAHWTRAESRERDKTYNPTTVAELETSAPGFPWIISFKEAGIDKSARAVVAQSTALPREAKIFADAPMATLKAWEAFHIADDTAPLLSKRFVDL